MVDAGGLPGSRSPTEGPRDRGRRRIFITADRQHFADHPSLEEAERENPGAFVLDAGDAPVRRRGDVDGCPGNPPSRPDRRRRLGPYVTSPPEVFDTALALLGLAAHCDRRARREMIRRGREFLVGAQQPDGSWPETTRPPGADSYAQRISTTGWALLALLATP